MLISFPDPLHSSYPITSVGLALLNVPSFYYWAAVGFGMGVFTVEAWFPYLIPFEYLGPVGTFLKYLANEHVLLLKIGYAAAVLAHVGEAVYVWTLCREMKLGGSDTLKWTVQTLLVGFSSLLLIKAQYNAARKRQ